MREEGEERTRRRKQATKRGEKTRRCPPLDFLYPIPWRRCPQGKQSRYLYPCFFSSVPSWMLFFLFPSLLSFLLPFLLPSLLHSLLSCRRCSSFLSRSIPVLLPSLPPGKLPPPRGLGSRGNEDGPQAQEEDRHKGESRTKGGRGEGEGKGMRGEDRRRGREYKETTRRVPAEVAPATPRRSGGGSA